MNDDLYSWVVQFPLATRARLYTVRDSFIDCGFSIRPWFCDITGIPVRSRFVVDHPSPGAITYWELRYGLSGIYTAVTIHEVPV